MLRAARDAYADMLRQLIWRALLIFMILRLRNVRADTLRHERRLIALYFAGLFSADGAPHASLDDVLLRRLRAA